MVKTFKLKPISKVKNVGEAQNIVFNYQIWSEQNSMSWGEVAIYEHYFETLAKKFKLTKEFKENGII